MVLLSVYLCSCILYSFSHVVKMLIWALGLERTGHADGGLVSFHFLTADGFTGKSPLGWVVKNTNTQEPWTWMLYVLSSGTPVKVPCITAMSRRKDQLHTQNRTCLTEWEGSGQHSWNQKLNYRCHCCRCSSTWIFFSSNESPTRLIRKQEQEKEEGSGQEGTKGLVDTHLRVPLGFSLVSKGISSISQN